MKSELAKFPSVCVRGGGGGWVGDEQYLSHGLIQGRASYLF